MRIEPTQGRSKLWEGIHMTVVGHLNITNNFSSDLYIILKTASCYNEKSILIPAMSQLSFSVNQLYCIYAENLIEQDAEAESIMKMELHYKYSTCNSCSGIKHIKTRG